MEGSEGGTVQPSTHPIRVDGPSLDTPPSDVDASPWEVGAWPNSTSGRSHGSRPVASVATGSLPSGPDSEGLADLGGRCRLAGLILIRPPRIVVAELKADRGRLSADQDAWLSDLAACGIDVHVWRPVNLDDGSILEALR